MAILAEETGTFEMPQPPAEFAARTPGRGTGRLLSATAIMAAGTIASRVLGLVRVVLAAYLLGAGTRQADILSLATTVPNSLYILFAGGALNTVLVPQIVRAVRHDQDGGEAYTNRIMTAFMMVVAVVTVILVVAAPVVAWVYSDASWHTPELAPQYASMVLLTAFTLPQVFFYGAFFLGGQVLNARDAFGPMMWAPIANNVVQVVLLLTYAGVWGFHTDNSQPFTTGQVVMLGVGSVLGIAAQTGVLLPFMRRVGFRYRPRFDLRHTGLGHTVHIAKWTLGFVAVNQAALIVVTKLATSATAGGAGAGETAYNNASLLFMLPHSLIAVGLATAMLPSLSNMAANNELAAFQTELTKAIRLTVAALVPIALVFLSLGVPIGEMAFRKGGHYVGWTLVFFAVGLVPFSIQYLVLRGYYAFEDTRSTFTIQVLIAALNAGFALIGVKLIAPGPNWVAPALAAAYALAYIVGVVVSVRHFRGRHVPTFSFQPIAAHLGRVAVASAPGTVVAFLVVMAQKRAWDGVVVDILGVGVGIAIAAASYIAMARLQHIEEVEEVLEIVLRRLRRGRRPAPPSEPVDEVAPVTPTPVPPPAPAPVPPPDGDPEQSEDDVDEGQPVALGIGDTLGGRYRLEEELAVRGSTVTWRAVDQVLSRSVMLHVLSPDNPRAGEIIDIARQAARATDSRFLRVLDAVPDDEVAYIVCEWAEGLALEQLLASGPLTALEAAWLVRELADALSTVHATGLRHGRLTPDAVVVSTAGNVKINGFLIDAALHPRSQREDRGEADDVESLGKLLYATLASRWPGSAGFGLPAAPVDAQGDAVPPASVRAVVSPTLDHLTIDVLRGRIRTSAQLAASLTAVLGSADASTDLANRVRNPGPRQTYAATEAEPTAVVSAPVREGAAPVVVPPPARNPNRMLLVSGILAAVVVLALVIGLVTVAVRRHDTSAGSSAAATAGKGSASAATGPYTIVGAKDFDPTADGGSGDENPSQDPLAYDGKADTAWTTLVYKGSAKLGGLKPGVGLILDLGAPEKVSKVTLTMVGQPTGLQIRVPATDPATVTEPPTDKAASWTVVATSTAAPTSVELTLATPVTTRYVLVYLTSLPKVATGYQGGIAEVTVS